MIEEEKKLKSNWWLTAVEIFSQVSAWVAVPIVVALIAGKWLDRQFDTRPLIFLSLTGLAFLISIFGIWKILIKYIKSIEEELKNKKDGKQ